MKSSIACFAVACRDFLSKNSDFDGQISFLITGDEEKLAINGTKKLMPHLVEKGHKFDVCLVGEPTSREVFGDEIKIGRRGSLSAKITISGTAGHVAYPHHSDNPIPALIELAHNLQSTKLDSGNDFFEPSNLEVIDLHVGNSARNVIPGQASLTCNIRFNNQQTTQELRKWILKECEKIADEFDCVFYGDGDAFLNPSNELSTIFENAVNEIVGVKPEFSTGGGTSDARIIKDYCSTIEFGPLNKTAHKIDECIELKDIGQLTKIYERVLEKYFSKSQS